MSIQLITFDLDDTLWDTAPVILSAETVLRDWLEANAPRYAKFYRMLEDTGRFDVQLQGSTVMARLKE